MFLSLLAVTFLVALGVSAAAASIFHRPIHSILDRILSDPISAAWERYLKFAILVVGVSNGVRIWELEKYITAPQYRERAEVVELTTERWVLEIYRTVIESLQGIAWLLLVFFVFALIAFVIVRVYELRRNREQIS